MFQRLDCFYDRGHDEWVRRVMAYSGPSFYAAPKRTDTSFDTPGSCMVTP